MQGYATFFASCAICSLMFIYDVQPSVYQVGKVAVGAFTALFIGAEILALLT